MKLFKNDRTGEMYVSMSDKMENLIRFDGSPYNGSLGEVSEISTKPAIQLDQFFWRKHIVKEAFSPNEIKDWSLKDELLIPIGSKEVAFRVEHITSDKIYFVAVDAVRETTMNNMNQFLDDYLSKFPKSLADRMVEIEHKNDGKIVRKSKLTLLSYANVIKDTGNYKLDGIDDIPFDGLLTDAERSKSFEGETRWYWLDTPLIGYSNYFLGVGYYGLPNGNDYATDASAVVPCFALPIEPKGNGKYLVKVREIYEHTYYVEAKSSGEAIDIVHDNSDGCDINDDYEDTEYEARIYSDEDPGMYDVVKAD